MTETQYFASPQEHYFTSPQTQDILSPQAQNIVPSQMQLSEIGKIADQNWLLILEHFPFVKLGNHVIMPNHVHGIIIMDKPIVLDSTEVQTQNFATPPLQEFESPPLQNTASPHSRSKRINLAHNPKI